MTNPYNRVILIGNGFDKAIGLNTSYSDFIFGLLKSVTIESYKKSFEPNDLISVSWRVEKNQAYYDTCIKEIKKVGTITELLPFFKDDLKINFIHPFLEEIVNQCKDSRWVDVEQHYFRWLIYEFEHFKNQRAIIKNIDRVERLNKCMESITIQLDRFISRQDNPNIDYLTSHISTLIERMKEPLSKGQVKLYHRHKRVDPPSHVLYLNFNYTKTVEKLIFTSNIKENTTHLYIHGEAGNTTNPIIFGFGDDTSDIYNQLELVGENEFLRMIKSFHYPRNDNYQRLLNYLSEKEFDVITVGHSCGISDRTLLKTIFEHSNCIAIQRYHYKGQEEDFIRRMEISRHFSDKQTMRDRMLPFDDSAIIPQLKQN